MLRNLIRYEFKATGRIFLPLYGVLLCFAIISKLIVEFSNSLENLNTFFADLIKGLSMAGFVLAMIGLVVATLILTISRFYKNLLCDEGYLMNTLPVSINNKIVSKLFVVIVWCVSSIIVALAAIFIRGYKQGILDVINSTINEIIKSINSKFDVNINLPILICIILFLVLITLIKTVLNIYSSISIGQLFNSQKLLFSFVAFIALRIIESIINSIIVVVPSINLNSSVDNVDSRVVIAIIILIILQFICIGVYYFICHYIFKNKLNLE